VLKDFVLLKMARKLLVEFCPPMLLLSYPIAIPVEWLKLLDAKSHVTLDT